MDMEVSRLNDMRALGYDKMINRKDEDWLQQIESAVGCGGVDVVIETTGSPYVTHVSEEERVVRSRIPGEGIPGYLEMAIPKRPYPSKSMRDRWEAKMRLIWFKAPEGVWILTPYYRNGSEALAC